jgi:hypothetical protein
MAINPGMYLCASFQPDMTFDDIQRVLDPNDLHPVPKSAWTDEDVARLAETRRRTLESKLASAKGKFDRINCRKALDAFLAHESCINWHQHRLRVRRLHAAALRERQPDGNHGVARRYLENAMASLQACRELQAARADNGPLDVADEDVFIRVEALHEEMQGERPPEPPPAAARTQPAWNTPAPPAEPPDAPPPAPPPDAPAVPDLQPIAKAAVDPAEARPVTSKAKSVAHAPEPPSAPAPATGATAVPSLPAPAGGACIRFTLPAHRHLTLLGATCATFGRSGDATVTIEVDATPQLNHTQSNLRISRIHCTVWLDQDDIVITDGLRHPDGRRKPSGNGSFLGPVRLQQQALWQTNQRRLSLISFQPEPGIPSWNLHAWRHHACAPPALPPAIAQSWQPEQPAALGMLRQDRADDVLFVWTALPLASLWPELPGWIVRHQDGFLYLTAAGACHTLLSPEFAAAAGWQCAVSTG